MSGSTRITMTSPSDVLCGRGAYTYRHEGNIRFQEMVTERLDEYLNATNDGKKKIAHSIVLHIRSSWNGRFIRKEKEGSEEFWVDIGDKRAIRKTCQALRDGIAGDRDPQRRGSRKRIVSDDNSYDSRRRSFAYEYTQVKQETQTPPSRGKHPFLFERSWSFPSNYPRIQTPPSPPSPHSCSGQWMTPFPVDEYATPFPLEEHATPFPLEEHGFLEGLEDLEPATSDADQAPPGEVDEHIFCEDFTPISVATELDSLGEEEALDSDMVSMLGEFL